MTKLTTSQLARIESLLAKATREDMRIIRNMFNSAIFSKAKQATIAKTFRIGDAVMFNSKGGETVRGTVVKVNTKTIKVGTNGNRVWTVSPSLLSSQF